MLAVFSLAVFTLLPRVSGHAAFWHPSMFGFNVTDKTFSYDNRPVAPIKNMNFSEWWFHNHLTYPPNAGDVFQLPAGQPATAEIACNKGATSYFASSEGGDIRNSSDPNNVCPGAPVQEYHTNGLDDVEGCALAIAYESNATKVQPEDFTVFSVNQTCVWTRFTDFQVPQQMPACPEGGCICAFFWIHSPDSGGEENYMNGFKCNVTGSTSSVPVGKSQLARRCGADPTNNKMQAAPANCTYGPKTPFYWFNNERNNMFEGTYSPPVYNDLYNFVDGAQNDIFTDSYISLPAPGPASALPVAAASASMPNAPLLIPGVEGYPSPANASAPVTGLGSANVNSANGSASASSAQATAVASSGSYAYKRDMSDAHVAANKRSSKFHFKVNQESRRRAVAGLERRSRFFW